MGGFYVLFESASGYCLVEVVEYEEIASLKEEVQASVQDLKKFSRMVKLKAFQPFANAEEALENALAVAEGSLSGALQAFLQANLPAKAKKVLMSFLEAGSGMEGGSDQIIGIVEQMKETMEADLAESEGKEASAKTDFETMMTSKTAEIAAAGKAIEQKTARSGQAAVETVQAKADLESTTKAVAEDTEFKANLAKNCAVKQKEWDERCNLRAEEIEAIQKAIEILSDPDAMKGTKHLSLMQASSSFAQIRGASVADSAGIRLKVKEFFEQRARELHSKNLELLARGRAAR